jgi:hypothetical protein
MKVVDARWVFIHSLWTRIGATKSCSGASWPRVVSWLCFWPTLWSKQSRIKKYNKMLLSVVNILLENHGYSRGKPTFNKLWTKKKSRNNNCASQSRWATDRWNLNFSEMGEIPVIRTSNL